MDPLLPNDVFALEVKPGEIIPVIEAPGSFRLTMAAIDPTAAPEIDPDHPDAPIRSTLKMIKHYTPMDFDSDEDDEDDEDIDEEDVRAIERKLGLTADSDDEEEDSEDEAGPSDPEKVLKARTNVSKKVNGINGDVDMDELPNGVNGTKKGKGKASDDDEDDSDMSEIIDDMEEDDAELPICTLDTTHHYQQALDLTIMDITSVSFKVIGTHSIFLTGNFVEVPEDDSESDEEDDEDYDDELEGLVAPYHGEEESDEINSEEDELDDLADPRIKEIDTDEEEDVAPKLVKAKGTPLKGKNKRPAESEDEEADLDKLISQTIKTEAPQVNGDEKLSKKQLKKLKKNDGQAAPGAAPATEDKKTAVKDSPANGKKVQFAKELEQGPTPTKADAKAAPQKPAQAASGVRTVQGVTIDQRKEGSGPGAKKGQRVEMRYIGKLEKTGKVFDSNKKGKPFSFKLGAGEVIKGWDVGLEGVKAGDERRLTIPAKLAYGSQNMGDIPPNSTLIFDVKCLAIK